MEDGDDAEGDQTEVEATKSGEELTQRFVHAKPSPRFH